MEIYVQKIYFVKSLINNYILYNSEAAEPASPLRSKGELQCSASQAFAFRKLAPASERKNRGGKQTIVSCGRQTKQTNQVKKLGAETLLFNPQISMKFRPKCLWRSKAS